MSAALSRRSAVAAALVAAALLTSSCAVGGYGYDDGVNIGVDYYEPFGVDYGGWGPGYRVGPYRGGGRGSERGGGGFERGAGGAGAHAYRPAAQGRSVPSIPGRSGGGGRSR